MPAPGSSGAAVDSSAPQSPQKRSPGSLAAPQLRQLSASGVPHCAQNRRPVRFSVLQARHVTALTGRTRGASCLPAFRHGHRANHKSERNRTNQTQMFVIRQMSALPAQLSAGLTPVVGNAFGSTGGSWVSTVCVGRCSHRRCWPASGRIGARHIGRVGRRSATPTPRPRGLRPRSARSRRERARSRCRPDRPSPNSPARMTRSGWSRSCTPDSQ
jgi:hypothetical protein